MIPKSNFETIKDTRVISHLEIYILFYSLVVSPFILPEVMKLLARWHHGTKWDEIDLDSDLRDEVELYLKELCPSKDNDVEQYVTDVAEAFNSRERVLITAKTIAEQISLS